MTTVVMEMAVPLKPWNRIADETMVADVKKT
jgi:hypothetical protein